MRRASTVNDYPAVDPQIFMKHAGLPGRVLGGISDAHSRAIFGRVLSFLAGKPPIPKGHGEQFAVEKAAHEIWHQHRGDSLDDKTTFDRALMALSIAAARTWRS
jgi:hypothetical protein